MTAGARVRTRTDLLLGAVGVLLIAVWFITPLLLVAYAISGFSMPGSPATDDQRLESSLYLVAALTTGIVAPHIAREVGRRTESVMIYWFATWQRVIAVGLLVFWIAAGVVDQIV